MIITDLWRTNQTKKLFHSFYNRKSVGSPCLRFFRSSYEGKGLGSLFVHSFWNWHTEYHSIHLLPQPWVSLIASPLFVFLPDALLWVKASFQLFFASLNLFFCKYCSLLSFLPSQFRKIVAFAEKICKNESSPLPFLIF